MLIENLHIETEKHRIRLNFILEFSKNCGVEDQCSIFNYLKNLIGIPVEFENGETWTLQNITWKDWERTSRIPRFYYIVSEFFLHFRSSSGKRSTYRSYFGGSKNKPQSAQRIVDLYQDELEREWWQRKKPSIIIDAMERFYGIQQGQN